VGMLKIKSIGLLFILLTLCTNTIFAQNSIYGHITDVNGNVLRDINVLLLSKDSSLLLNFSITNEKGYYSIILPQKTNFYIINIKTLHYETVYQQIENKEQKIDFKLKESENSIKEVVVKSNPVFKQGDTISYIVRAFATQEDRVLADVLRKMPGIEVATNGQITYLENLLKNTILKVLIYWKAIITLQIIIFHTMQCLQYKCLIIISRLRFLRNFSHQIMSH
jgi:hypothetical protein